jgi:hypothetical protein
MKKNKKRPLIIPMKFVDEKTKKTIPVGTVVYDGRGYAYKPPPKREKRRLDARSKQIQASFLSIFLKHSGRP